MYLQKQNVINTAKPSTQTIRKLQNKTDRNT